ncbi:aminoglycoside phosphotransferase family protein [Streptomyces sp. NRRL B-24484]|uniref:aminoglycoside phosphotransferase family protein n=1 Tax=Streptomyces sp. NRRL B-24484 TaxID=1463833 RepID=UPI0007C51686|nr:aminoglycoside phosphotransferase family protein [Streptomyces sp. NRRL B-24484]
MTTALTEGQAGAGRPEGDRAARELAERRVRQALGAVEVVGGRALRGGLYNSVRLVELADGRRLVLKAAPPADAPALTHEQGLLDTERLFHRLAAATGAPVPAVLHHEPAGPGGAGEWLLLEHLDGRTWDELRDSLTEDQRMLLRGQLGAAVARIAGATGPRFGYPGPVPGLQGADWPTAFAGMLAAVLADAERFGVTLPVPSAVLAALPVRFGGALAEVRRPALVHFDAWEGNLVLTPDPVHGGLRLGGLIDGERAFFGDPLAELVGLDPLGSPEDDPGLMAGYRSVAPGLRTDTAGARARLALYRIHLALVMRVESAPRGYAPEHTAWLLSWSADRITEQLAVLDGLAAGGTEAGGAEAGVSEPGGNGPGETRPGAAAAGG